MTKSKSSTIAIVVLSVLLAAALASTIVLAAFTNTKSATTTITFSNGVTLTLSGDVNETSLPEGYQYNIELNSSASALTESATSLKKSEGVKAAVTGADAWVRYSITPSLPSGYSATFGSASSTTGVWNILKGETKVAELTVTGASVVAAQSGSTNTINFTTSAQLTAGAAATLILADIGIVVESGQFNNITGLTITLPVVFVADTASSSPTFA